LTSFGSRVKNIDADFRLTGQADDYAWAIRLKSTIPVGGIVHDEVALDIDFAGTFNIGGRDIEDG
jgi:hypothetical protein